MCGTTIKNTELYLKYMEFLTLEQANEVLNEIKSYSFQTIKLKTKGIPSRKCLAIGEPELTYEYYGTHLIAEPWNLPLITLKKQVEAATSEVYNFALIESYANGYSNMSVHQYDDTRLDADASLSIICLGASRIIHFNRKKHKTVKILMNSGSLLQICPPTNQFWERKIKREPIVTDCTISITFKKLKTAQKRSLEKDESSNIMKKNYVDEVLSELFKKLQI